MKEVLQYIRNEIRTFAFRRRPQKRKRIAALIRAVRKAKGGGEEEAALFDLLDQLPARVQALARSYLSVETESGDLARLL